MSSSSSASDSDSEIDKKAKRKKQAVPEKPLKKQKMGESSKGAAASKQSSNRDENMFQVKLITILEPGLGSMLHYSPYKSCEFV